jgi:hypothetical protein
MEHTMKRRSLVAGLGLSLLAALVLAMALGSSSASASTFCGGQTVNNVQRCFGGVRVMTGDEVVGASTGACAGADTYSGTCAPQGQRAYISGLSGEHNPWAQGTGSSLTYVAANTF